MIVVSGIAEYREARRKMNLSGPLVFVPTMGALHAGHGALISMARGLAGSAGAVVASIFVNPSQFGPNEDFHRYPRPFAADTALLNELGTDLLFAPDVSQMYPAGPAVVTVDPGPLADVLEGAIRPGHFRGVCTVVAKLLAIVAPDILILGRKDYQQQAVVKQMIHDLNFCTSLVVAPTVREPDGLAMSSRNRYLSADQRPRAAAIYQALQKGRDMVLTGRADTASLSGLMTEHINRARLTVDYALACDPDTLAPCAKKVECPVVLLAAARLGNTRLIDNLLIEK